MPVCILFSDEAGPFPCVFKVSTSLVSIIVFKVSTSLVPIIVVGFISVLSNSKCKY